VTIVTMKLPVLAEQCHVGGLLVYCADYRCAHAVPTSPMTCGCPISNHALCAKPAASAVPTCGRISIGMDSPLRRVTDRHATIFSLPSLALAIEKQPGQARPERTAQEHPQAYDFEREHHRIAFALPPKIERQRGVFGSCPGRKIFGALNAVRKCGSQMRKMPI